MLVRVWQIVCKASGRTSAQLLRPLLEKLSPALEKRRLMPLKHAQLQMGNAAAFTYCMQQKPPLLPLSQVGIFSADSPSLLGTCEGPIYY